MRFLCRYFNDIEFVLGGLSLLIITCAISVGSPAGPAGLHVFFIAVCMLYSIGYPIAHTAVGGGVA